MAKVWTVERREATRRSINGLQLFCSFFRRQLAQKTAGIHFVQSDPIYPVTKEKGISQTITEGKIHRNLNNIESQLSRSLTLKSIRND